MILHDLAQAFLLVPWLQFGHVTFSGGICASAVSAGIGRQQGRSLLCHVEPQM